MRQMTDVEMRGWRAAVTRGAGACNTSDEIRPRPDAERGLARVRVGAQSTADRLVADNAARLTPDRTGEKGVRVCEIEDVLSIGWTWSWQPSLVLAMLMRSDAMEAGGPQLCDGPVPKTTSKAAIVLAALAS